MQNSEIKTNRKNSYTGFTFRQRLIPVILLSLAAGFTVCFFGPFDIYGNNIDQFTFKLGEFFWWNVLYTLSVSAIISAILLPLRKRLFDIAYAAFLWITIMLFIQGNYLNFGINSLAGDGLGDSGLTIGKIIVNALIWIVAGCACILTVIFVKSKHRDIILTVGIIAMITVIGMQLVTFAVGLLTTDVLNNSKTSDDSTFTEAEENSDNYFLTYENFDTVSSGNNIIYFVIDRFDVKYYEENGLKDCPELFYNLDGFTYFNDMTALYPRTFPAVTYMLTGVENDFTKSRLNYFKDAYTNSDFLKTLKDSDYNVNIFTDTYYGYDNAIYMRDYISNSSGYSGYTVKNSFGLASDMLRLSLYRYLPLGAKKIVGNIGTDDFNKYIVYNADEPKYTTDMKDAYYYLKEHALNVGEGTNNFTFIHLKGTHLPNKYDADFNPADSNSSHEISVSLTQSFKIINLYIDSLKELGLYENSTIIITGDHGALNTDTSAPETAHLTALFVKERGSAGTPLKVSSAPVAQEDIIPTILRSAEIQSYSEFGRSVFEIGENEQRQRKHYFQVLDTVNGETNYEFVEYKIIGRARDFENWEIVSRHYIGKSIYD